MKIMKTISEKAHDNMNKGGVVIAFLGDSVTQGCFELYKSSETAIETVFDRNSSYPNYISKIFSVLFPNVPVNIINAGISGDTALHASERLERDVLKYNPDLAVVCFGLNDAMQGNIEEYKKSLENIFGRLQKNNIETIFMTANMMCTSLSPHLADELMVSVAGNAMKVQNSGCLEQYFEEAKKICKKYNVHICDCYAVWKKLNMLGVDTTDLLANKINHPTREMNWLFALSLVATMME